MPEFFESSDDLLASGGWLAAHKKSQSTIKSNPVSERSKSLSGERMTKPPRVGGSPKDWQSWSYPLFIKK